MKIKRFLDVILSFILIIFLIPLFLIEAILITLNFRESPIYLSKRSGLFGKPFTIYKFKSLPTLTDENGEILDDRKRITRFGKILRSTSLDELPQLLNVLFGEMSLVGPRPLDVSFFEKYSTEQRKRLDVRPGITGLAQVNGRNSISWEKKFELDCYYVENFSLYLDIKILILTVFRVFKREGISQDGFVNTEMFKGENE